MIRIEVEDQTVLGALRELLTRLGDPTPALIRRLIPWRGERVSA
jgi:hypothetical protein